MAAQNNELRVNDRIRAREVRLIDADGNQLGVQPTPEALRLARDAELDLVEIAPQAEPPVCKIMDFGKHKFDLAQKAKESRRKTVNVTIKEMKYRPKIGKGDFDTKTRKVEGFLTEGHKVKLTIMFRGREVNHPELGKVILDRVAEKVAGIAKIEAAPKLDGRNMIMVLAPDRRAAPKKPHAPHESPDEVATDEVATDEVATDEVATDEVATDEVATEVPTDGLMAEARAPDGAPSVAVASSETQEI